MECLRFGFDFPSLNRKATTLSSKVLGIPITRVRRRGYRAKRVRKVHTSQPPVPMKIYNPPVFSIELENLFDVLSPF